MTELSIRPDEIRDALQRFVSDYKPDSATKEEVGTVAEAADGIARVTGLPSVMANELLEFEDGTLGIALNLDTREIGVVVLGDFDKIEEGQTVRRTGEILSVDGTAFESVLMRYADRKGVLLVHAAGNDHLDAVLGRDRLDGVGQLAAQRLRRAARRAHEKGRPRRRRLHRRGREFDRRSEDHAR